MYILESILVFVWCYLHREGTHRTKRTPDSWRVDYTEHRSHHGSNQNDIPENASHGPPIPPRKIHLDAEYGKNEKDTGSAAVQIAMMSQKISELTEHLKSNKKDFATKRGLLMMVGKRKRLLSYLKAQNLEEYRDLIKKLGIRG